MAQNGVEIVYLQSNMAMSPEILKLETLKALVFQPQKRGPEISLTLVHGPLVALIESAFASKDL